MRMWMVNPKIMCTQHMLGEHVEIHMFLGHLRRRRQIHGYIKNNCLEPLSIQIRHDMLVQEMERRCMSHKSKLILDSTILDYLPEQDKVYRIKKIVSLKDLIGRCKQCKDRFRHLAPRLLQDLCSFTGLDYDELFNSDKIDF